MDLCCATPGIVASACGQPGLPMWPSAYAGLLQSTTGKGQLGQGIDKPWQGLALACQGSSQCVWVPAYIAYGLLELEQNRLALEQKYPDDKGCEEGNLSLKAKDARSGGPQEQEFHQQMLRKLALHLAAQPDAQQANQQEESSLAEAPRQEKLLDGAVPLQRQTAEPGDWNKDGKKSQGKSLSLGLVQNRAPHQDFNAEMLRKLALHLAAQPEPEEHQEEALPPSASCHKELGDCQETKDVKEVVLTPDVFPATPSSFGEEQCDQGAADNQDESFHCSPSISQCVWMPMYVAYGLLDSMAPEQNYPGDRGGKGDKGSTGKQRPNWLGPQEQEFHQQMLQKMALHLAAQPETLHAPSLHSRETRTDKTRCDNRTTGKDGMRSKEGKGQSLSLVPVQKGPDQQYFHQEMLRKLALHLAAQPESKEQGTTVSVVAASDPHDIVNDKRLCDNLIAELEASPSAARASDIVAWILPAARTLSLTRNGSRLVQKAIDVSTVEQREQLAEALLRDVTELCTSPHANHVIAKLVEVTPPQDLANIGEAMRGKATTVARHQFGSRILERLIENCEEDHIGFLLDEIFEDFEPLARHQFGNFVVQRLFEHSTASRKSTCVQKLLPHVLQHATHKTACNIVQCMLFSSDLSCQTLIADVFLAGVGETTLESIAATRYGSFVVHHLVDRFHPRIDAVKARVKAAHSQLQESGFSQRRIVEFLGESFFQD